MEVVALTSLTGGISTVFEGKSFAAFLILIFKLNDKILILDDTNNANNVIEGKYL